MCATDKIAPHATWEREERDPRELYDGDADIAVSNPTFDVTPASTVTVVTERGVLGRDDIEKIADAHRDRSEWIAGG